MQFLQLFKNNFKTIFTEIKARANITHKNFNIVARMLIPMEECKRFCQEEAGRRFKKKYWNPITIKIAIA